MIIGIDIRALMDSNPSGVPEYTFNLIKNILKLDQKNEYRLFYNSFRDQDLAWPEFKQDNVRLIKNHYPNKILNYLGFKFLNRPKINSLLGEIDVFFMPHINLMSWPSKKFKSILTIHDLSFLRHTEFFSARKNFWHRMINVQKMVKHFDIIVAVSENTKRDLMELCGVAEEKIKVIYSGTMEQWLTVNGQWSIGEGNDRVREKYKLPEKFILYLGTLEPRKNIEGLIKAYEKLHANNKDLRDYKLVLAGGKGWKSKNIFEAQKKSPYKDDIIFLGYVDRADKNYLYQLASVFVYPSFYEGFGFPPLEAMAAGAPVITGFTSSLSEIVGNAGLMIDPYNITDLVLAMEKVLTNNDLRNNLIQKGLEQARKFDWGSTAGKYLEIMMGN
jgi:glycosyltransferase involved in cell wall biosynthesis